MRRFLSVWLPRWPTERQHLTSPQAQRPTSTRSARSDKTAGLSPFAFTTQVGNTVQITAVNETAEKMGVHPDMSLTDARALYPALETRQATPEDDLSALHRLTLWCLRYSPLVTLHPPDGFALDITGCAHLFGGEKAMFLEIENRLSDFGLTCKTGAADTIGAAWAAARYGRENQTLVQSGNHIAFLSPLPLGALRLPKAQIQRLNQLGLRKIGHLIRAPHAPLTSRFGPDLIRHLQQATGATPETFNPLSVPPTYTVRHPLVEPVQHLAAVEATIEILARQIEELLKARQEGARLLNVLIFRVDGHLETLSVQTSSLCQEADHITLLFREKIAILHDELDTGFGIDLICMSALKTEFMPDQQSSLSASTTTSPVDVETDLATLLDRFGNRLGFNRITRFIPFESYIPEKSVRSCPVTTLSSQKKSPAWEPPHSPRPFLLFSPAEPITVIAEVPDGPPLQFKWRRLHHHITRAEGPERLAPEWWDVGNPLSGFKTRDYYRVENALGHRFWLYRDGLYERTDDRPRWYMQGLFP
ncbi:Y-family DNA polymerase [Sneathiella aquimaris]|uniref:Y-family DNA polymerase n=1 Tax=Sneathiella aquimaris TaxID=2599305 RepID=UPI00146CEFF3|nr:DNA polymerase Y family protein [Sneathiella aquimaris]